MPWSCLAGGPTDWTAWSADLAARIRGARRRRGRRRRRCPRCPRPHLVRKSRFFGLIPARYEDTSPWVRVRRDEDHAVAELVGSESFGGELPPSPDEEARLDGLGWRRPGPRPHRGARLDPLVPRRRDAARHTSRRPTRHAAADARDPHPARRLSPPTPEQSVTSHTRAPRGSGARGTWDRRPATGMLSRHAPDNDVSSHSPRGPGRPRHDCRPRGGRRQPRPTADRQARRRALRPPVQDRRPRRREAEGRLPRRPHHRGHRRLRPHAGPPTSPACTPPARSTRRGVPGIQVDGYFPDTSTTNTNNGWNHDSQFVIRIPDDWNGGLVVTGAPGNRTPVRQRLHLVRLGPRPGLCVRQHRQGQHRAAASTTTAPTPGGSVREWNSRVTELTLAAKRVVKQVRAKAPQRTWMAGISNGGYLVRWQLENRPDLYDGGLDWEGTLLRADGPNLLTYLPTALKHYPAYAATGSPAGPRRDDRGRVRPGQRVPLAVPPHRSTGTSRSGSTARSSTRPSTGRPTRGRPTAPAAPRSATPTTTTRAARPR